MRGRYLRHTHLTHLLRSGVPLHVVSARAGHANPTVTLNVYSHLLEGDQEKAAAVMDEALRGAIKDRQAWPGTISVPFGQPTDLKVLGFQRRSVAQLG
jgi:Phage integrase family